MIKRVISYALIFVAAAAAFGCAQKKDLTLIRQQAYQAYLAADYANAVEQFQLLVQEIPGDAELWFRLGNAYAKTGDPKNAVAAYENALLRDPRMAKAWYNKGLIHLQAALKSFVDMKSYTTPDDPASVQGKRLREGIGELLKDPVQADGHEE